MQRRKTLTEAQRRGVIAYVFVIIDMQRRKTLTEAQRRGVIPHIC